MPSFYRGFAISLILSAILWTILIWLVIAPPRVCEVLGAVSKVHCIE